MSTPPLHSTKHATKTTLKATPKTSIPFGFYSHMQHIKNTLWHAKIYRDTPS